MFTRVVKNILADSAARENVSQMAFIKECVRIFNSAPSYTTLKLVIETKETYTGIEDGVESD